MNRRKIILSLLLFISLNVFSQNEGGGGGVGNKKGDILKL